MPEGDTIHKLASVLAPELDGRRLRFVELEGRRAPSLERSVHSVRALGKNLLIALHDAESGGAGRAEPDSGAQRADETIRCHLGMHGNWRRYASLDALAARAATGKLLASASRRAGEAPRRRSLVLATDQGAFVCFDAEPVECLASGRFLRSRALRHLGQDLLGERAVDVERVVRRARHFVAHDRPVADLLLDQRVAAGIGNVYKSELLHLHGIAPNRPLAQVDDQLIADLYRDGERLLRQNLGPWKRTTTWDPRQLRTGERPPNQSRLFVYGRVGETCISCGDATVLQRRLGRGNRSTYWCPRCQVG